MRDYEAEIERLRAQRDYYRRRWIVRGTHYPYHLGFWRDKYVAAVMEEFQRRIKKDGS